MKIVLLRHGKPDIKKWYRIPADGMGAWIEAYNNSGIESGRQPSTGAVETANSCNKLLCSTLQRSIESAELLGHSKPIKKESVFNEMGLPFAHWKHPRLSPEIWLVVFRLLWLLGYSKNCASFQTERQRVKTAAEYLVSLAKEHGSVMLAGHGLANRYIAGELLSLGWTGPRSPGSNFWDFAIYRK